MRIIAIMRTAAYGVIRKTTDSIEGAVRATRLPIVHRRAEGGGAEEWSQISSEVWRPISPVGTKRSRSGLTTVSRRRLKNCGRARIARVP